MGKNEKKEEMYVRVMADFQNYKKRVEKERAEWIVQAKIETVKPLLGLIDDLDRAIASCKDPEVLVGLELVKKNMVKRFSDLGVEEIDCSGEFDPNLHEAVLRVDSDDYESGQIVEILSKGYTLRVAGKSQVLQYAKVSVAT